MALVLDSGPIVALLDADDPAHERCVAWVESLDEELVVPVPVLVEVDYWLRKLDAVDAWVSLAEDVAAGTYRLGPLDETGLFGRSSSNGTTPTCAWGWSTPR